MAPFNRFLILWFGQLISSIGSGLTAFALGIYAFRQTGSETSYSLIMFLAFLPSFLLRPFGGALADMMDRRLLMMIGDLGSAMGLVFIIIMMSVGYNDLWVVYLGIVFNSIFVALQNPAFKASITDLVDAAHFKKASGLTQLAESAKFLISPIVAGFLYTVWDIKNILILDIMTFLIAILAVFGIKRNVPSEHVEKKMLIGLIEGFKYLFLHKGLFWLLSIISIVTFFVGFYQALLGPMILAFTDAKIFGLIQSLSAAGMLVSSAMIGFFSQSRKHLKPLSFSLVCTGIFYALIGISTNIIFLTIAGFFFFFSLPFINTNLEVLIRKNVDNKIQGRVWSIVSLISQSGMVIALGIAGSLAEYVFNPILLPGGFLASSIGQFIGTGQGRGIGVMFILSGIIVASLSICVNKVHEIQELE